MLGGSGVGSMAIAALPAASLLSDAIMKMLDCKEQQQAAKATGPLKLRHLPTSGGGPALTALMGNNVQALVSSIAAASGQLKAGKARALASFGATRASALPEVPTMKELGYDIEYFIWAGMFAPAHTPCADERAGSPCRSGWPPTSSWPRSPPTSTSRAASR